MKKITAANTERESRISIAKRKKMEGIVDKKIFPRNFYLPLSFLC